MSACKVRTDAFSQLVNLYALQLALSADVILRTLSSQAVATLHGLILPALLREYLLFCPDLFHNLEEGEIAKFRTRFKLLLLNRCRALALSKPAALLACNRALDKVDRWGAADAPYARPGKWVLSKYHRGWLSATALFGWDHVNMLAFFPMLLGFNDLIASKRIKKRLVSASEAILEVHRLAYQHSKDARACEERRLATTRYVPSQKPCQGFRFPT